MMSLNPMLPNRSRNCCTVYPITVASVRSHLRNLEGKGFLTRQMRVGKTNRFHLLGLFSAVEDLMEQDAQRAAEAVDEDAEEEVLV